MIFFLLLEVYLRLGTVEVCYKFDDKHDEPNHFKMTLQNVCKIFFYKHTHTNVKIWQVDCSTKGGKCDNISKGSQGLIFFNCYRCDCSTK